MNNSIADTRYSTTKRPTPFVGPRPDHPLNVPNETKKVTTNIADVTTRRSQTDNVVPSSYNWNPTKPFMSKQAQSAEVKPFCTAMKYGWAPLPGGTTPASRIRDRNVKTM
jgi:hypothetical protein